MICVTCGNECKDTDSFCARCSHDPKRKPAFSDFELGRIAALDSIRKDFWSRFAPISLGIAIVALFGVNELAKNTVRDAVNEHIKTIQQKIDELSTKAVESGAEANIETKKVEASLADVDAKRAELGKSLDDIGQKKEELERSLSELDEAKVRMVTATTDLQKKENALKQIIESENLTTIFAKLRNDFYRVHTLRVRVEVHYSRATTGQIHLWLNTISLSKATPDKTPREELYVAQFHVVPEVTNLVAVGGTPGAVATYEMYTPFEEGLVNAPMNHLDGIDKLSLQFGPVMDTAEPAPSVLKDLDDFVNATDNLVVQVELNGIPLNAHQLSKQELQLPADRTALEANHAVTFNVVKDVAGSYKDVKTLYDTRVSALKD